MRMSNSPLLSSGSCKDEESCITWLKDIEIQGYGLYKLSVAKNTCLGNTKISVQHVMKMTRIIIVSNRLPITLSIDKSGSLKIKHSVGGLATGIDSLTSFDKLWIGWPGQAIENPDQQNTIKEKLKSINLVPVYLSESDIQSYYYGFSNKTLWPHFHYFTQYTQYNYDFWKSYKEVNEKFADALNEVINVSEDIIWVHDYQLMLLPAYLRERFPNARIGYFLHIPFPSFETFRTLPWRKELLMGVLGADNIGFHTVGYFRHFLSAVYRICGYEHSFNRLFVNNRLINVDVFPMSIDYDKYANFECDNPIPDWDVKKLKLDEAKIVLSIDRLDYTKGIPSRIRAFEKFLYLYPEYRMKVTFVMVIVPCRTEVDCYQKLQEEIETLIGAVNGKLNSFSWSPIVYIARSFPFEQLCPMLREADVCLVTPLRDGMNLVAKEYVAAKDSSCNGVLILSEMAGASDELTDAVLVNPHDENDIVDAIYRALNMPIDQQRCQMKKLQNRVKSYNVHTWANLFVNKLEEIVDLGQENTIFQPDTNILFNILSSYHKSRSRLIMFDYDKSLLLHNHCDAVPDLSLIQLLTELCADQNNRVVITTFRDREAIDKHLGHIKRLDVSAEDGHWKRLSGKWCQSLIPYKGWKLHHWKNIVRSLILPIQSKTPGSSIVEKKTSIVWHFRGIAEELRDFRIREIRYELMYLIGNRDIEVIEGKESLEIKHAASKRVHSNHWWFENRARKLWDIVIVVGDDLRDQELFSIANSYTDNSFTINVGMTSTIAKYSVPTVCKIRHLIKHFTSPLSKFKN
ncbi:hypothetical protein GJ496_010909 [Pomphorhynchus laevis]|nr:hypothetical protein GJ496_010909 [Pomphorhynchus laevis]